MSTNAPDFDLEFKEAVAPERTEVKTEIPEGNTKEREVPDKYKGKDLFDIIDMHVNAEKKISQQGSEIGELRRTSDELLGLRKENAPKPKIKVTTEDLLTDPDQALNKAIDQSSAAEKVAEQEERLNVLERSLGQKEFQERHPEFLTDAQDTDFQKWVSANKARAALFLELNNNYNFEAGTALWDMWDEHKSLQNPNSKPDKANTIRAARTVRNSPSEGARKPTYSRVKLMELQASAVRGDRNAQAKWNDPAFQKEYQAAYAEGRIK